jgi:hypothetical protein
MNSQLRSALGDRFLPYLRVSMEIRCFKAASGQERAESKGQTTDSREQRAAEEKRRE